EAGLDIVTDGNMWYDDYVGVIGSFCWYMYERIGGFAPAREQHPSTVGSSEKTQGGEIMDDWGGVINSGPVTRGPIRLADLYKIAKSEEHTSELQSHLNLVCRLLIEKKKIYRREKKSGETSESAEIIICENGCS